jgi:hypothetical protein
MQVFGMPVLVFCLVLVLCIAAAGIAWWKFSGGEGGKAPSNTPKPAGDLNLDLNMPPPPPPSDFGGRTPRF